MDVGVRSFLARVLIILALLAPGIGFSQVQLGNDATPGTLSNKVISCTQNTIASVGPVISLNLKCLGAEGNALSFSDGTITSGSNTFTSNSATFTSADVGKTIQIDGAAGVNAAPLVTTISGYNSAHSVTLTAGATATTPGYYLGLPTVTTAQATGSYVPGDVLTLTGGTHTTQATVTVTDTKLISATVTAAGTGGNNGACTLQGTTGAGTLFQIAATISGNSISALGSITQAGHYFTKPTTLSAEPVTSTCGITGATLNLVMGIEIAYISNAGVYSAVPSSPVATGAGSISGATGATFSPSWITTGNYVYATDDSTVLQTAVNTVLTDAAAGVSAYIYAPSGNYYIGASATGGIPTFYHAGGGIVGDGHAQTQFIVGAAYASAHTCAATTCTDLFSWSEAWGGYPIGQFNGPTAEFSPGNSPYIRGIGIVGDLLASGQQNAFVFYDRNDTVFMDDVIVRNLNGRCLYSGVTSNTSASYMRESNLKTIKCFSDGQSGVPVVEFNSQGSGDATNEIDSDAISIYGHRGPGLVIRNNGTGGVRSMRFGTVRVEGTEYDPNNVQADNVVIGDSVMTGNVNNVSIRNFESIDMYAGFSAIKITAPNATVEPYQISIGGVGGATGTGGSTGVGGGLPLGYGINVQAGRSIAFHMFGLYTWNTNVTLASSATVSAPIILDIGGAESQLTYNVGSGSNGALYTPQWSIGQPALANASNLSFNTPCFPYFQAGNFGGFPTITLNTGACYFGGFTLAVTDGFYLVGENTFASLTSQAPGGILCLSGSNQVNVDSGWLCGQKINEVSKTTAYTISIANGTMDIGKQFDNVGASGSVVLTLPTAAKGLYYCGLVEVGQTLEFLAVGSDKISGPGATYASITTGATAGNIQSNTVHSSVCLKSPQALEWDVISETGSWTIN